MEIVVIIGIIWIIYVWLSSNSSKSSMRENQTSGDKQGSRTSSLSASGGSLDFDNHKDSDSALIRRAIETNRALIFRYTDQNGDVTYRTVTPSHLERRHSSQILCLVAYCHLREANRTFVVRKMQNVSICDAPRDA